METITVPITHAPINITPIIITAVIVFLVLGVILLIRTRKFMDAKDSTTLSFLLVMLLLIPFNIGASAYVQKPQKHSSPPKTSKPRQKKLATPTTNTQTKPPFKNQQTKKSEQPPKQHSAS